MLSHPHPISPAFVSISRQVNRSSHLTKIEGFKNTWLLRCHVPESAGQGFWKIFTRIGVEVRSEAVYPETPFSGGVIEIRLALLKWVLFCPGWLDCSRC